MSERAVGTPPDDVEDRLDLLEQGLTGMRDPAPVGAGTPAGLIAVVGLGYVGLPTALALAEAGHRVIGCDISPDRLLAIESGAVDVLESDRRRLDRHRGSRRLSLTADPDAVRHADTVIVCVPTPVDANLTPVLEPLAAACRRVVDAAVPGQTVILTSTTYVGCTRDLVITPLRQRGLTPGTDVFVAFSPERIDPGNPAHRPETTPRVVGGATAACTRRAVTALADTCPRTHEVSCPEAAEMSKLLENTFRAVNIAFANEFADAARELGMDAVEVIDAAATKPYGFMPFSPGAGVGGHCIPCDPHYLLWQMRARRFPMPLTETAMTAIAGRPRQVVARAREVLAEAGTATTGARVLVVGVAYKPGIADLRESSALRIIAGLHAAGAEVCYHDPLVPRLRVDGRPMSCETDPGHRRWDLVLVHTAHPGVDYRWLARCPVLLDATYRLTDADHRATP